MIATVDASIVVKWYFEEEYSDAASRLLSPAHSLLAPDLLIAEFAASKSSRYSGSRYSRYCAWLPPAWESAVMMT